MQRDTCTSAKTHKNHVNKYGAQDATAGIQVLNNVQILVFHNAPNVVYQHSKMRGAIISHVLVDSIGVINVEGHLKQVLFIHIWNLYMDHIMINDFNNLLFSISLYVYSY